MKAAHQSSKSESVIDRRQFLQQATVGAIAMSNPRLTELLKASTMGIVVHSYAIRWNGTGQSVKYPGFDNALQLLDHCHAIGAGGLQVGVKGWSKAFAKSLRDRREKLGMYLEGSIALPKTETDLTLFTEEVAQAREAGANVLRTVCHWGRRYEVFDSLADFEAFKKQSVHSLQLAESVVRKYKMKLAVENHKDWRADELVSLMQRLSSEWIGVTLDFGNSISLLEDPDEVARKLTPYVLTTHVKDMGVAEYEDGFLLSEVPLGEGILDLPQMVKMCKAANAAVTFNLEMITRDPLRIPCLTDRYWETFEETTGRDLARTLRTVRSRQKKDGSLPLISTLSPEEKLEREERNILDSLDYSKRAMGLG